MIHIPIDQTTKVRAQRVARRLGMPLNRLVHNYVKTIAKQTEYVEPPARQMSKKLEKILGQVEKDFKAGKNIVGPFQNADEAIRYFDSL